MRANRRSGSGCGAVGVDAHSAEVVAEPVFEERTRNRVQWLGRGTQNIVNDPGCFTATGTKLLKRLAMHLYGCGVNRASSASAVFRTAFTVALASELARRGANIGACGNPGQLSRNPVRLVLDRIVGLSDNKLSLNYSCAPSAFAFRQRSALRAGGRKAHNRTESLLRDTRGGLVFEHALGEHR